MSKLLKIGLASAAAIGLFFGLTNESHAATNAPVPPKDIQAKINAAIGSADPHTIRIAASQVEAAGFPIQADSMRRAANDIEAEIRRTLPVKPGAISPLGVKPVTGTPVKTQADQNARTFAGKVARMLTERSKGREDRAMVRTYQIQEQQRGQPVGAADGLYGAKTALTLAQDHGIVPPKPMYWPKATESAAKINYAAELLAIGARDPSRLEEWQAAAKV